MSANDAADKVAYQNEADNDTKAPTGDIADLKVDLATGEHAHLSVGDILRGTAVHESTPFERKAALINA